MPAPPATLHGAWAVWLRRNRAESFYLLFAAGLCLGMKDERLATTLAGALEFEGSLCTTASLWRDWIGSDEPEAPEPERMMSRYILPGYAGGQTESLPAGVESDPVALITDADLLLGIPIEFAKPETERRGFTLPERQRLLLSSPPESDFEWGRPLA